MPIGDFGQSTLVVDGQHEWPVMVADTPELRARGLMNVTDLGPWAGMVFLWEEPTDGGFWMKNTLIPLTVYWIDTQGFDRQHRRHGPVSARRGRLPELASRLELRHGP